MILYLQMIDTPEEKNKFEQIYLTYQSLMFWVANEILHNTYDAEDAVHQAFISIAKNMGNISEPVCPKTKSYIVTIVENKAIDIYRKKKKGMEVELKEEISGFAVEYHGSNGLTECILKLPAPYREVILLKYYQGYEVHEIARLLGISGANAAKRLQRAKQKLETLCREEGVL